MGSATSRKREILLTAVSIVFGTTAIVTTSECTTGTPLPDRGGGMSADTGSAIDGSAGSGGSTTPVGPAWLTPPATSGEIAVPQGATETEHLRRIGVQIYNCTTAGGGTSGAGGGTGTPLHAWTLTAPEAQLLDAGGTQGGGSEAGSARRRRRPTSKIRVRP
jgi:hypothetical protein